MYNSLSALPSIPYNILVYLATQDKAENLWKMLADSSYNCLSRDNLTFDEKMALVWKNGNQEDFGVFLTPLTEDAFTESKSIFKVYQFYIQPHDLYVSAVTYSFDFLYGGNMTLVEYDGIPVSRGDVFVHILLDVLNGAIVGGVGKLEFSNDISRYSLEKMTIGNSRTFTGVQLFMSVEVGDTGEADVCGG